jgi:tetratricopeptide (TPR) repeat protein
VLGFVLLSGGDGGRSDGGEQASEQPRQERRQEATPTAEATPDATREATPEPEATAEATPETTPEPTGEPNLERAAELQLAGYNARQAGDYEQALQSSQAALEACGDAEQLSPCGYALFEVGAALNALGRSEEAIPVLQQRLEVYGDNESGEVQAELEDAQANAGGEKPEKRDKKDKGDDD